jgi:hypothetical protein
MNAIDKDQAKQRIFASRSMGLTAATADRMVRPTIRKIVVKSSPNTNA